MSIKNIAIIGSNFGVNGYLPAIKKIKNYKTALICCKSDKSFLDKEKSATSAAATIAVQNKRQTIPIIPMKKLESKLNCVKLGSGSKVNNFGYLKR
jgi:hypothetical protein